MGLLPRPSPTWADALSNIVDTPGSSRKTSICGQVRTVCAWQPSRQSKRTARLSISAKDVHLQIAHSGPVLPAGSIRRALDAFKGVRPCSHGGSPSLPRVRLGQALRSKYRLSGDYDTVDIAHWGRAVFGSLVAARVVPFEPIPKLNRHDIPRSTTDCDRA
jgi:hypothetical protein